MMKAARPDLDIWGSFNTDNVVIVIIAMYTITLGAQWLSGRVLDSRSRPAGSSLTGVTSLCP